MKMIETFSTTADVGIRVRGKDLAELYSHAVKGLNLLYFGEQDDEPHGKTEAHPYVFHGDSGENVLVNLLLEMLFLVQHKGRRITGLEIESISETDISATFRSVPLDRNPDMEIKAVTYHNLEIKKENGSPSFYSVTILFDV